MILLAELPMTSHGASLAKLMATQALEQFLMVGLCGGHAPFPLYPPSVRHSVNTAVSRVALCKGIRKITLTGKTCAIRNRQSLYLSITHGSKEGKLKL